MPRLPQLGLLCVLGFVSTLGDQLVLVSSQHFRCSTHCLVHPGVALLVPFGYIVPVGNLEFLCALMSGKRQKLPAKRGRANEDPTPNFDVTRFVNEGVADRFAPSAKTDLSLKKMVQLR